ncbi:MAG TPA: hypothetical protein DEP53_06120 [Bacteroidetes bacterium]|nr:hypothetical protein [Bacteroidota bacterium]
MSSSKPSHALSNRDESRLKKLLNSIANGRTTNWTLPNSAKPFDDEGAKRASKRLAKSGLLSRHIDSTRPHYA